MSTSFGNITNLGKKRITSGYGTRGSGNHKGIDIGVPSGTQITAPLKGKIIAAKDTTPNGCGGLVKIDHGIVDGSKLISKYCHVKSFIKKEGDDVNMGEAFAISGGGGGDPMRGRSTGPHIHFEVLINGNNVDPTPYYNQSVGVTKQELSVDDTTKKQDSPTNKETGLEKIVSKDDSDDNDSNGKDTDAENDEWTKSIIKRTADLVSPIFKSLSSKFTNESALNEEITKIKKLMK